MGRSRRPPRRPPQRQMGGKEGNPGMPGYSGGYYGERVGEEMDTINGRAPDTDFERFQIGQRRQRAIDVEVRRRNDPDLGIF